MNCSLNQDFELDTMEAEIDFDLNAEKMTLQKCTVEDVVEDIKLAEQGLL